MYMLPCLTLWLRKNDTTNPMMDGCDKMTNRLIFSTCKKCFLKPNVLQFNIKRVYFEQQLTVKTMSVTSLCWRMSRLTNLPPIRLKYWVIFHRWCRFKLNYNTVRKVFFKYSYFSASLAWKLSQIWYLSTCLVLIHLVLMSNYFLLVFQTKIKQTKN